MTQELNRFDFQEMAWKDADEFLPKEKFTAEERKAFALGCEVEYLWSEINRLRREIRPFRSDAAVRSALLIEAELDEHTEWSDVRQDVAGYLPALIIARASAGQMEDARTEIAHLLVYDELPGEEEEEGEE